MRLRKHHLKSRSLWHNLCLIMVLAVLVSFATGFTYDIDKAEIPFKVEGAAGEIHADAEDGSPEPENAVITTDKGGTFVIGIEEPGDYYYTLYQKPGTQKDIVYDETEYEVLVSATVTQSGDIECRNFYYTDEGKAVDAVFANYPPETEDQDKKTEKPQKSEDVKTGDKTSIYPVVLLMSVSFAALASLLTVRRKGRLNG